MDEKTVVESKNRFVFQSQGTKTMLDLHGLSVQEVKKRLEAHFAKMEAHNLSELYVITGRGSHVNSNGSRGVLKKILPKLLKPYSKAIIQINQESGAYKIILKPQQKFSSLKALLSQLFDDEKESLQYAKSLKQKSEENDIEAILALAVLHLHQAITGFDHIDEGVALLLKAKKLGSLEADVQLGILYHEGTILKQDHQKAFNYFSYAANQGHPVGQYYLAVCYLHGKGVKYHDPQAVHWMKKSADQNDAHAQQCLSDFYLLGEITQQNKALGIDYKIKAAEQGLADAQIDLARCYATGYGVKQDYQKAFEWYLAAAESHKAYAIYQVGSYLLDGRSGFPENPVEAFTWFLKAAELGDADAQAQVAYQYLFGGIGVDQNIEKGLAWAKKAVEQQNRYGYYTMASAYLEGIGVEKDPLKALHFMELSAKAGHSIAQYELGLLLIGKKGAGIPKDRETGIQWLEKSATQNCAEAQQILEELFAESSPKTSSHSTPFNFFSSAPEQGKKGLNQRNVSQETQARKIPIIVAIMNNQLAQVKRLVSEGADVNIPIPGGGKTPLHIAIELGYTPIAAFLITAKANVNAVTGRQFTPLHVAAQKGNSKLIELLVKAGAEVNACSDVGCTPLHEAAANGQKEATLKLLALNANPTIKETQHHLTAANLALEKQHNVIRDILCQSMGYQACFIQNIHYALFNGKRAFSPLSVEYPFLDKLSENIVFVEEADEVFKKVSATLKSPEYIAIENTLKPLRSLLIASMKQYNTDKLAAMQPVSPSSTTEKSGTVPPKPGNF